MARLAKRTLQPGIFSSIADLQVAINRFITEHNQSLIHFVRNADPDK